MNSRLRAENISSGYGDKIIIEDLSLSIPDEKISVIIGSNASGKSTLLKTFTRLIEPVQGKVLLDDKEYRQYDNKILAQNIGLLPQSPLVPQGIKVYDLVARGRFPYQTLFKSMGKEDFQAIDKAMEMMGISDLGEAYVDELSGGQKQRVWIAMVLAQDTDIIFLDEPTTYLDITYQVEILDLLKYLNLEKKITIVMVLHDINMSIKYGDYIFAMKEGSLVKAGPADKIIDQALIKEVYNLDCEIIKDPVSNIDMILPISKYDRIKN